MDEPNISGWVSHKNNNNDNDVLTPNHGEIQAALGYARRIYEHIQNLKTVSEITNQGYMNPEIAQKGIDNSKKEIQKELKYLKMYLEI